ncbi:MAG: succinylglutamate desuccinylase/aspartoacylase family protein [Desulfomonile tiedjei]|uniref:Succinylglutamate desuccinylase/aspartoacylase family protein n=1 Tax=Desulfomonile tiedjei TaxID=2358 RepID=A0A9D6V789_9BACT|nr:succinylglutamate desuccinylase/aspartoacylase family protein [Desulfomonile tiedjei]
MDSLKRAGICLLERDTGFFDSIAGRLTQWESWLLMFMRSSSDQIPLVSSGSSAEWAEKREETVSHTDGRHSRTRIARLSLLNGFVGRFARISLSLFLSTLFFLLAADSFGETSHRVYFKGTDSELDVYTVTGSSPGPTLLILGGIQGDEPGGYLAADLYADMSLNKGNMIVVPRANFLSIIENARGVLGDMNRKFAGNPDKSDRDARVVQIIKDLMKKSDFFLNLHDGSGFYSTKWESPDRNPSRFGQSIIADTSDHKLSDGRVIRMEKMVNRVLERVNPQISAAEHTFKFNNHQTLSEDSRHKEQRLSATYHALTQVGIPAFGIETSKNIKDYRLRVRYQTMVVNAFLEEFGIIPDSPRIYLDNQYLKYVIVSVNGRVPIVVSGNDVLKVHEGDVIRIVHIESNYSRGLTARIKGRGGGFNDLNQDVVLSQDTTILVRKDRFVIGSIPVELIKGKSHSAAGIHFEPKVKYFSVRVNDRTFQVEPGEEISVFRGDVLVILDPLTNLPVQDEKAVRVDLRGFQAESSPYPNDDRGHRINTASDLQDKYGRASGQVTVFPLHAKLDNKVFAESFISVVEPKAEYLVLKDADGGSFVVYPGDKLELPIKAVITILDVKSNLPGSAPLFITMSGKTVRWDQKGSAGIDASKLPETETPLDITRAGKSLGRIWIRRGGEFRLSSGENQPRQLLGPARY